METRIAQIIDRLVTLSAALPGYRMADAETTASNTTAVWDGPEVRSSDDASDGSELVIGWSGPSADEALASASSSIKAGPMAGPNRPREEEGFVNCLAIGQNAPTPKAARDAALQVVEDVAELCRSTPDLGIDTSGTIGGVLTRAYVTAGDLVQYLQDGYVAEWQFTVNFKTRV
jgi:hypothetical protein